MPRPLYVQAKRTALKAPISSSEATEIVLTELLDLYGNALTMANLNATGRITINPGGSTEEIVEFTDFTVNDDGSVSIDTGIARGRAGVSPYTSGGTGQPHAAGEIVVLSNNPQMYEEILDYIDDIAISGSPNGSTTAKGIFEEATLADIDADTASGSTGARLAVNPSTLATSKYGTRLPTADEKAALAGAGSTAPSGSNKYLTQASPIKHGGTGADGALAISSGTTTLDLGGAQVFVKNYTSIAITGTGVLAFSNPHANGTTIVLKSQGAVTLTSSATPMIDASGMGAAGGAAVNGGSSGADGLDGSNGIGLSMFQTNFGSGGDSAGAAGESGALGAVPTALTLSTINFSQTQLAHKYPHAFVGAGGGSGACGNGTSGNGVGGAGGRGGGCLIIECGGALNFTTASGISVAGKNGTDATALPAGSNTHTCGGAGGGGGYCLILATTITANTGTITVSGGTKGADLSSGSGQSNGTGGGGGSATNAGTAGVPHATASTGGTGGAGLSLVALNTEYA